MGQLISGKSLPLNVPEVPAFHRESFKHEIKDLAEGKAFDDLYTLNTQSGTQWDGFRHVLPPLPSPVTPQLSLNELTTDLPPRHRHLLQQRPRLGHPQPRRQPQRQHPPLVLRRRARRPRPPPRLPRVRVKKGPPVQQLHGPPDPVRGALPVWEGAGAGYPTAGAGRGCQGGGYSVHQERVRGGVLRVS